MRSYLSIKKKIKKPRKLFVYLGRNTADPYTCPAYQGQKQETYYWREQRKLDKPACPQSTVFPFPDLDLDFQNWTITSPSLAQ